MTWIYMMGLMIQTMKVKIQMVKTFSIQFTNLKTISDIFFATVFLVSAENNPNFDYPEEVSEDEELESESSNDESEDNDDEKQSSEANDVEEDDSSEDDKVQQYDDEVCGDFDFGDADSFDCDSNGGHEEGEDWRWSYR